MKKTIFTIWTLVLFILMSVALNSCTAGITMGRGNSVTQTVTNAIDSTSTTFRVGK